MMQNRVHTLGLHIIDIVGKPILKIPESQDVVIIEEIHLCIAGTAAATAMALRKLGIDVSTIGCIGNDLMGRVLIDLMRVAGVDISRIRTVPGLPTSASILPIRPNGERPALHVIGATADLRESDICLDAIFPGDIFHIGGTFLIPGLDGEPTRRLAEAAKLRGAIVTMDFITYARPDLHEILIPTLPFLDYIFPNLEDAQYFAGLESREDVAKFYHAYGVGCTVITMGADGVSIWPKNAEEILIPAIQVDVVDTSGCGDAFAAGFLSGLIEGLSIEECGFRGVACGSLVATGLGSDAGLQDRPQILKFMETSRKKTVDSLASN